MKRSHASRWPRRPKSGSRPGYGVRRLPRLERTARCAVSDRRRRRGAGASGPVAGRDGAGGLHGGDGGLRSRNGGAVVAGCTRRGDPGGGTAERLAAAGGGHRGPAHGPRPRRGRGVARRGGFPLGRRVRALSRGPGRGGRWRGRPRPERRHLRARPACRGALRGRRPGARLHRAGSAGAAGARAGGARGHGGRAGRVRGFRVEPALPRAGRA